jgi:hypothetical protein
MSHDCKRVTLHLDGGPLLVEPVRAAVYFQATQAGLETEACENLAKATGGVCHEALLQLTDGDPGLDVTIETFADRLEVSIHHGGQLVPAVEAFTNHLAAKREPMQGGELLRLVDRVMFNSEKGAAKTTLLKFLPASPAT